MPRVIDTDNFGGDYPGEKFVSGVLSEEEAQKLKDKLNKEFCKGNHSPRWHQVVADDYELVPGFRP
jgi:hypothetical protein